MAIVKKLIVLCLAAAALVSCLPVPFDQGISQGLATAGKMTQDNPGSITASYNQGGSAQGFTFYPSVAAAGGFDYSAGFITALDGLTVDMSGVSGGMTYSGFNQPVSNPDPHAPPYLGWPVKSGTSFLFGIVFDAQSPASSGYAIFQATPPSSFTVVTSSSLSSLVMSLGTGSPVIGASVSASPSAASDLLHVIGTNPATLFFQEAVFTVQSTGIVTSSTPRGTSYPLPFIPSGLTRMVYFYDDNAAADPARVDNRSFGSWYDTPSASWVTWAWWETPTGSGMFSSKQLPVTHRLDALLSTGQLFSTEGGMGRVYDRDGNLQATFPLGNLTYIAEEYVGGAARCYFSQCLVYNRQLHFNVYWIRTDQLASLGS